MSYIKLIAEGKLDDAKAKVEKQLKEDTLGLVESARDDLLSSLGYKKLDESKDKMDEEDDEDMDHEKDGEKDSDKSDDKKSDDKDGQEDEDE